MHHVLERLAELQLLPVVTIDEADRAVGLGQALLQGGLPCAEITFRTPAAEEALRALAAVDGLLVGAGTILDEDQVARAVDAGARFLVSPGLDEDVVRAAQARDVPILPGVATPTEVQRARRLGLEVVKLFPAEALGGIPMLKALAAPFPGMRFVPTGGVSPDNLGAWLERDEVPFCGGSWLAPRDLLERGDLAGVQARVARAVAAL